jgi:hypothetical protein
VRLTKSPHIAQTLGVGEYILSFYLQAFVGSTGTNVSLLRASGSTVISFTRYCYEQKRNISANTKNYWNTKGKICLSIQTKDQMKYDVRFIKPVMASAIPLVTHITCIITNTQCSTAFGQFTFGNIIWLLFDSVKLLHDTHNKIAL